MIVGEHNNFFLLWKNMELDVDCTNRTFTNISEMGYETTFSIPCSFGFKCLHSNIVHVRSETMERGNIS